jgi:excisionase family DNA binding protein
MRTEIDLAQVFLKDKDMVKVLGLLAKELTMRPDQIITQAEAAKLRGVKRQRINQLVNEGRIRSTRLGNQVMVLKEDVQSLQVRAYTKK